MLISKLHRYFKLLHIENVTIYKRKIPTNLMGKKGEKAVTTIKLLYKNILKKLQIKFDRYKN